MVKLKARPVEDTDLHDLLKAMDAMRHNWEIARTIIDKMVDIEDAHNAKDVEGILKEVENGK